MIFNAELRGRFVKDGLFSLKVLSLHKGIINLLYEENSCIISLIADKKNMTGLSLLVPEFFIKSLEDLSPGDVISLEDLNISYGSSEQWTEMVSPDSVENSRNKDELPVLIREINAGNSLFALLTDQYQTVFQRKARKILSDNVLFSEGTIEGLNNLVGLGQGMTPAGDDFITGALLAAEHCKSIKINKKAIESELGKTTYAGRTLLYLALNGSFPAYLQAFLKEKDAMTALSKASLHGSTSGLDSLAGFYWFLQFLAEK